MSNKSGIVLIHNPIAGWRRRGRLRRTVDRLRALGHEVDVLETTRRGDAEFFAAEAQNHAIVAVAGGDGTVNEVLNGLPRDAPPLAFVPLGTANVLACELGMGKRPTDVADLIHTGTRVAVYGGRANGRRFALMVSAGIDAWTVKQVKTALKRSIGALAYGVALVKLLSGFPYPTYRVEVDGRAYEASTVVVTLGSRYGGPFVIAPDADLRRPELCVVMTRGKGLGAMARYAAAIARGRLQALDDVVTVTGRRVRIDGPLGDPVQADGDLVTTLPLDVSIDETPYRIIAPQAYVQSDARATEDAVA